MKLPSKPGLLSMRGISAQNADKKQVCYEVAFKTRIVFNERDISPKHRQTSKQKQ
jgi:hypothetical protein